jgi:hypothetical protein
MSLGEEITKLTTRGGEEDVEPVRLLGGGGFGTVYEVWKTF